LLGKICNLSQTFSSTITTFTTIFAANPGTRPQQRSEPPIGHKPPLAALLFIQHSKRFDMFNQVHSVLLTDGFVHDFFLIITARAAEYGLQVHLV